MNKFVSVCALGLILAGCSASETPVETPVETAPTTEAVPAEAAPTVEPSTTVQEAPAVTVSDK